MPSEEPSCCAVFCRPPASLRSSSPTADWTTLPSWETIRPMPTPSTPIATRKAALSSSGSIVAEQHQDRDEDDQQAGADQRPRGEALGQRRAGERGDEEPGRGGQHPHPGFERVEPLDDLEEERDREEDAHQDQVLGEQHRDAAAQLGGCAAAAGGPAGPGRARPRDGAPRPRSAASTSAPAAITNGVSEKPKGSTGELRGASQPQLLACSTPKTTSARPAAESTPPTQSRRGRRALALGLADQPRAEQDADRDDDLADEDDPPAQLGRRPAAEDRADRDAGAGDAAEHAVGDRPVAALVVAGDEGDQGRQDQRRADPLEDRPAEHQAGHAPGGGGERRADAVDARGRSRRRGAVPRGRRACRRSASAPPSPARRGRSPSGSWSPWCRSPRPAARSRRSSPPGRGPSGTARPPGRRALPTWPRPQKLAWTAPPCQV